MLLNADNATKRVPINKLIERIDVTNENIIIRFKINLNDFFPKPRISDGYAVAWFCWQAAKKDRDFSQSFFHNTLYLSSTL